MTAEEKECNGEEFCGDDKCQKCCAHDEYDHGICLYCGLDITEELVAKAEFLYELAREE